MTALKAAGGLQSCEITPDPGRRSRKQGLQRTISHEPGRRDRLEDQHFSFCRVHPGFSTRRSKRAQSLFGRDNLYSGSSRLSGGLLTNCLAVARPSWHPQNRVSSTFLCNSSYERRWSGDLGGQGTRMNGNQVPLRLHGVLKSSDRGPLLEVDDGPPWRLQSESALDLNEGQTVIVEAWQRGGRLLEVLWIGPV